MEQKGDGISESLKMFFTRLFGTNDYTHKYTEKDRVDNKVLAFLAYVVPPLPFLIERNNKYVVFHSNQGMNNLLWVVILQIFIWIADIGFHEYAWIGVLGRIFWFFYIVLCIVGVINVMQLKAKEIPIVSKLNLINIIGGFFGK